MLSPIILFLYNRPWHTIQTLDALAKNKLATDSILYIFCDGIKENAKYEEINRILETRKIAKNENRFKEIIVIEQKSNKGLANSIIDGVTAIVNKYGKVIVLEDDIVTSKGFLAYMNEALNTYENEERVMHISGYMFPERSNLPETFFVGPTTCWGWATWSRAWSHFEKNVEKQIKEITEVDGWREFTINNSYQSYKNQLLLNRDGVIDTWAIFWQTSVFLKGAVSLHPNISLVQNIGFDGSGVHCEAVIEKNPYYCNLLADEIKIVKQNDFDNKDGYFVLENFFRRAHPVYIEKENVKLSLRDKQYVYRQNIKKYFKNILRALLTPSLTEKLVVKVLKIKRNEVEGLNECAVLLYHRIIDIETDPQLLAVKPTNFINQLALLQKNFHVLRVDEFENCLKNKINFPKKSVLITFDDGYADNYLEALPILESYGMEAIFYISTGTLNTNKEYWWDAIERIVLRSENEPNTECFEMNQRIYHIKGLDDFARKKLYETLLLDMKVMRSESREKKIEELAVLFNNQDGRLTHRALTFDELKKMDQSKAVTIGAHTHFHPSLAAQTFEDQLNEISSSKQILESHLEKKISHFSYPFGGSVHYNQDTLAIVKQLEFDFVAANIPFLTDIYTDRFQFSRFLVRDWEEDEFKVNIEQFFNK